MSAKAIELDGKRYVILPGESGWSRSRPSPTAAMFTATSDGSARGG